MTWIFRLPALVADSGLMSHSILNSRYRFWIFLSYVLFVSILVFSAMVWLRKRKQAYSQQPESENKTAPIRRPKFKRIPVKPPPAPDPIEGRVTFQNSKTEVVSLESVGASGELSAQTVSDTSAPSEDSSKNDVKS